MGQRFVVTEVRTSADGKFLKSALTQLQTLWCSYTQVSDFSPIQHLIDAGLTVYKQ